MTIALQAQIEAGRVVLRLVDEPTDTAMEAPRMKTATLTSRFQGGTVWRRIHDDFVFGEHYEAWFAQASREGAQKLGAWPAEQETFVDEAVAIGQTVSYWVVGPDDQNPWGPACVKRRDPEVWWSAARIREQMRAMAALPGIESKLQTYGLTALGREIEGIHIGHRERCVAFVGLVHAGETGPELLLPVVERLMREQPELLTRCGVAVLPAVCADERERMVRGVPYYRRANARGVDLNRNFDGHWSVVNHNYGSSTADPKSGTYRGPEPASEPETRAVMAFVTRTAPRALFSMHWLASVAGDRWLSSQYAAQDTAYRARCEALHTAFSEAFRGQDYEKGQAVPGGPLGPGGVEFIGSGGTLPTWAYETLGVPALDVEHYNDQPGQVCRFDRTTRAYLEEYRQRWYRGVKRVLEVAERQED